MRISIFVSSSGLGLKRDWLIL